MVASVRLVDEHFGPTPRVQGPAYELRLASERVTPREIIRRRVEAEVEEINRAEAQHVKSLARTRSFLIKIEENSPGARLNGTGPSRRKPKPFDVEHEVQRALDAFEGRSFIMLFNDRQIDDADEEVALMPETEIAFVYLTPLMGG